MPTKMMSAYEELRKRCYKALWADGSYNGVDVILAEVFRTLETVTPNMYGAGEDAFEGGYVREVFAAMLRASPLSPPKEP